MGGGVVMRAAAKITRIDALRGVPGVSPLDHTVASAARRATRPVAAAVTSPDEVDWNGLTASQNNPIDAVLQRPCWELDDWEFAGGEEETFVRRHVFGGVPTPEEAKEATSELKDALDKVYISPHSSVCSEKSLTAGEESALSLLSKQEYLETKDRESLANPVPKSAFEAFRLLEEIPGAQSIVTSIASDANVWNAVLQNEALVEFLQSHKSDSPVSDTDVSSDAESVVKASVADTNPEEDSWGSSPKSLDDFANGVVEFLQGVKLSVVEMMNSLSGYFQNVFGGPVAEDGNGKEASSSLSGMDKAVGASFMGLAVSFMGLAVMVILTVVLKRVYRLRLWAAALLKNLSKSQ